MTDSVCAVIVTFHPQRNDLEHLSAVRPQVDGLVVVDNGSMPEELELLRISSRLQSLTLIECGANLGIAVALNVGVRWAKSNGFKWVVLFDQDSLVTDGFIAQMLADFKVSAEQRNIMQLIPRYRDPETGEERTCFLHKDGGPLLTITSGSLFPISCFDTCGYFREELFIYCVDDDFSLRIRMQGFSIAESKIAVLLHRSGRPTYHSFLGKKVATHNYRPQSRYYWMRNKVWLLRTYWFRWPQLIYPSLRGMVIVPLKVLVFETSPGPKLQMFLRGFVDGIRGKMGKVV